MQASHWQTVLPLLAAAPRRVGAGDELAVHAWVGSPASEYP